MKRYRSFLFAITVLSSGATLARVDSNDVLDPVPISNERLAMLAASEPMTYFDLAEEIGYEAQTDSARALAKELVLMSWLLTPDRDDRQQLERSVALLLADLATTSEDRRRFLALTGVRTDRSSEVLTTPLRAILEAIGATRRADWVKLRTALRSTPPENALVERGVTPDDATAVYALFERLRSLPALSLDTSSAESVFMTSPQLSSIEQELLMRVEAAIVGVEATEWADSVFLTDDSPARLETLGATAAQLGIRADKPLLRMLSDGTWEWAADDQSE